MQRPHLRPAVVQAREQLAKGREKLRAQHDSGSPGVQVCARQTDLLDSIVLELYASAASAGSRIHESLMALVAHGGYGRRDVAPYSDVDLMVLVDAHVRSEIVEFIQRFTQSVTDAGLQLGFSVRSPKEACDLALKDATIFTALLESRYLAGNTELYQRFIQLFQRRAKRRSKWLIKAIDEARRAERRRYGETVYVLEPNVKRSSGGLRDLQFLRWIGFARYGEAEPENLERLGVLSKEDRRKLQAAREFLLRLRNELHFHAGKSQDVLGKSEQLRLSEHYGYASSENLLPVEQFMRDYIEHTREVHYITAHFLANCNRQISLLSLLDPFFDHRVDHDFRIGLIHIRATRAGLKKITSDLAETLHLMELSNWNDVRIDHATWEAVRKAMTGRAISPTPEAAARFLSLLSQPARLGNLLHRLHELRVLEKLIPPMAHARCLMQFNDYHKFTVDEHSIRAVEAATEFLSDAGPLGEAYRGLRDKRMLHLALLVHDLGKGYAEDHCEVGSRLAVDVARGLGLSESDTETLRFLVHKHLMMSHLAQRRDISDERVVVQFAVEVGSTEILQMLYVLTCADLSAVGPGVLNRWKLELITQLYERAREYLSGELTATRSDESLEHRREELRTCCNCQEESSWWNRQVDALPHNYLKGATTDDIADKLSRLAQLRRDQVVSWSRYLPEMNAVEFTIGAYETVTPGIFHKLTGALTSKGLTILSADIHTLADELVLDRFHVLDPDHSGEPTADRLSEINEALVAALTDKSDRKPAFRKVWTSSSSALASSFVPLPTRVQIDNNTSDNYTILDIFAHDRRGLLYAISRTIFELGLSVHVAKIGTYLDQVVDVFYVTDNQNRKVQDEAFLAEVRNGLLTAIEQHSNSTN